MSSSTTPAEIQAAIAAVRGDGPSLAETAAKEAAPAESAPEPIAEPASGAEGADAEPAEPEAPAEEAKPEEAEKADKPPAKTWAALFKAQRQMRERESKLTQSMQALEARQQEAEKRASEAESLLKEFEADKYEFVKKRGFDYDAWATRHLNNGKPDPSETVARQLEALKAEQAEREAKLMEQFKQQQAQEAHNQRSQAWLSNLETTLENPRYAPIKAMGEENEVVQLQVLALKEHNKWLTPAEASDLILKQIDKRFEMAEKAGLVRRAQADPPKKSVAQQPEETGSETQPRSTSAKSRRLTPAMERKKEIERLSKQLRWR